ncbi:hypothetical protein ACHAW6_007247 [Cyclotella cf. meneghiniana]
MRNASAESENIRKIIGDFCTEHELSYRELVESVRRRGTTIADLIPGLHHYKGRSFLIQRALAGAAFKRQYPRVNQEAWDIAYPKDFESAAPNIKIGIENMFSPPVTMTSRPFPSDDGTPKKKSRPNGVDALNSTPLHNSFNFSSPHSTHANQLQKLSFSSPLAAAISQQPAFIFRTGGEGASTEIKDDRSKAASDTTTEVHSDFQFYEQFDGYARPESAPSATPSTVPKACVPACIDVRSVASGFTNCGIASSFHPMSADQIILEGCPPNMAKKVMQGADAYKDQLENARNSQGSASFENILYSERSNLDRLNNLIIAEEKSHDFHISVVSKERQAVGFMLQRLEPDLQFELSNIQAERKRLTADIERKYNLKEQQAIAHSENEKKHLVAYQSSLANEISVMEESKSKCIVPAKCYHKIAKRGIEQLVKIVKGKKADDTELRTIHEMREIFESNDIKMMKVYVLGEAIKKNES